MKSVMLALAAATATVAAAQTVDLFIGTQGVGNVTPAATWPFGLVQAGPDTSAESGVFRPDKAHCGGYHFSDKWLWRFSQTHISGTGVNSLGDFGILPISGNFDAKEKPVILLKQSERAEPGLRIGARTLIAPDCKFYTPNHPMDYLERREPYERSLGITVGEDCWIGGGSVICPGVTIGNRVVVAAGSVVVDDVPDDVLVAGNPAVVKRRLRI